jgi:hypothetical protein
MHGDFWCMGFFFICGKVFKYSTLLFKCFRIKCSNKSEYASYEQRSKKQHKDFTRRRKMGFKEIIYTMLYMVKESTQNALERVFPSCKKKDCT